MDFRPLFRATTCDNFVTEALRALPPEVAQQIRNTDYSKDPYAIFDDLWTKLNTLAPAGFQFGTLKEDRDAYGYYDFQEWLHE